MICRSPEVLQFFLRDLEGVDLAARFSLETAKADIETLRKNIRKLEINVANAENPLKEHLREFLEVMS